MRLVSVMYDDFHPFAGFGLYDELVVLDDPNDLKKDDHVIIWGGADIHPSLYGKKPSKYSGAGENVSRRDRIEWEMIQGAVKVGATILGVCRGAQMACAAAGGYLIQHVNGHGGNHTVTTKEGNVLVVNSLHHQMMQPGKAEHVLLAHTTEKRSDCYWDEDKTVDVEIEPEYIYFPKIKAHAIQWHPEMMRLAHPAQEYIKEKIKEYA